MRSLSSGRRLRSNKIGDQGATAIAEALNAEVQRRADQPLVSARLLTHNVDVSLTPLGHPIVS
jgi:hypothetical protein